MYVYEARLTGDLNWSQLFLYPPTQKNLLNALKKLTDKDFSKGQRERLANQIEEMGDYWLPDIKEWADSFPVAGLEITRRWLQENRVA
jgi:DNA-binding PadR family transcriptional regulator